MVGRAGFSLTLGAGSKEIVVQGAAFTLKGIAERLRNWLRKGLLLVQLVPPSIPLYTTPPPPPQVPPLINSIKGGLS